MHIDEEIHIVEKSELSMGAESHDITIRLNLHGLAFRFFSHMFIPTNF